ncbi:MAG: LCP family protein [Oscillospiraceae bacterium]|nr:LCP family protein [Oscillospiraceae bacterium]
MARKNKTEYTTAKIFFITFISSFLILITIMLPIALRLSPVRADEVSSSSQPEELDAFVATPEQNLNVLCIDKGSDYYPTSFALVRIDAMKNAIYVSALPPDMCITQNDEDKSITEVYNYGGAMLVTSLLAEQLDIELSKYIAFDSEAIIKFINITGAFTYNIPYDLKYKDTKADIFINIPKGEQMIDGRTFLDLYRFPNFSEGYLHKYQVQGHLISTFINYNMNEWLKDNAEGIFTRTLNMTEHNLSIMDYIERKALLSHFISQGYEHCEAIYVDGNFSGQIFYISDKTKTSIKEHFSL